MGSLFFPQGHGACKILFVSSKNGVSVSPSPVEVLQSNPTGLQSQISRGLLIPLLDAQAWKPDIELRTITTVGELLWHYCFPVHGPPTQWVWDFILLWFYPSYHLVVASLLSLDIGYLFLVWSSILLLTVVQQLVAGGDEHMSFYSTILNQSCIFFNGWILLPF